MKAVHCGWAESNRCYSCLATGRQYKKVGMSRNVGAVTLGETRQVLDYKTAVAFRENIKGALPSA